jgi:hypothetical protein
VKINGTALRRLAANTALALFAVLVVVLLVEIGLRVAGVSHPDFVMADEDLGFAHRPGAEGWWRREGKAYVRINEDGLRDHPHAKAKPQGTVRVAILGDSYAEAFQVPHEDAFWAVMERDMEQCPAFRGRNVEVINFGVSNYGTAQELLMLRKRAWAYSPDIVVLAFFTGNDIHNNSRTLADDTRIRPFFVPEGDTLVLDTSFRADPWFQAQRTLTRRFLNAAIARSRVLQVANAARRNAVALRATPAKAGEGFEPGLDDEVFREPADTAWTAAWKVTERLLGVMAEEVRRRGARFLVVTLSNGIQAHPDPAVRAGFARRLRAADLFYPDRRVAAVGAREGFPVLGLAPALQRHAERNQSFVHGFDGSGTGHWNREGHAVAGHVIAGELCRNR